MDTFFLFLWQPQYISFDYLKQREYLSSVVVLFRGFLHSAKCQQTFLTCLLFIFCCYCILIEEHSGDNDYRMTQRYRCDLGLTLKRERVRKQRCVSSEPVSFLKVPRAETWLVMSCTLQRAVGGLLIRMQFQR